MQTHTWEFFLTNRSDLMTPHEGLDFLNFFWISYTWLGTPSHKIDRSLGKIEKLGSRSQALQPALEWPQLGSDRDGTTAQLPPAPRASSSSPELGKRAGRIAGLAECIVFTSDFCPRTGHRPSLVRLFVACVPVGSGGPAQCAPIPWGRGPWLGFVFFI
jgi:hypothetical protein